MNAVHFGAGNIGRGFIGSLLYQTGFSTTFVDVNQEVVDLINAKGEYRVVLADQSTEEFWVRDVQAINSQLDPEAVIDAIAQADIITTAVGPTILPLISGILARGLRKRAAIDKKRLNIIACENMIGGSEFLKEKVYEHIDAEEMQTFDQLFFFPNAAVDRIVPLQTNKDPLMVKVEPFFEWVVEKRNWFPLDSGGSHTEKIPTSSQTLQNASQPGSVTGMKLVDDLTPYIERKLFTVNTGHAISAYLGYVSGLETINDVMKQESIRAKVKNALIETGQLLIQKYGFDSVEHEAYMEKILQRFANPYITDEVTRVGRSPIRKLGSNDRLVSPAKQYVDILGKQPEYLAAGIAAALLYDYEGDSEAVQVQSTIQEKGIEGAIEDYTGLTRGTELVDMITKQYDVLRSEKLGAV